MYEVQNYNESLKYFDKVIYLENKNYNAFSLKIQLLIEMGRYDEARAVFNKEIESHTQVESSDSFETKIQNEQIKNEDDSILSESNNIIL